MLHEPTSSEWFLAAQAALLIVAVGGYHLARPLLRGVRGALRVSVLAFGVLAAGIILVSVVALGAGIRASGVDVEAASFEAAQYPSGPFAAELVGLDPDVTEDVAAYLAAALLPMAAMCVVAAVVAAHARPATGLRWAAGTIGAVVLGLGVFVAVHDTGGLAGGAGWVLANVALLAVAALAYDEVQARTGTALAGAGAGTVGPPIEHTSGAASDVRPNAPAVLPDHLVYAVPDLDAAIDDLAARLGARPANGGRHVGLGTRNALLALGSGAYLEVIGPDPEQPAPAGPMPFGIDTLTLPRLTAWAARTPDLDATLAAARSRGYDPGEPMAMSRERPDGVTLQWRLTPIPAGGDVVPFLIDWGTSPHPSIDAPAGVRLEGFELGHPDPDRLRSSIGALGLDVAIAPATVPTLRAVLVGPAGRVEL